MPVGIPPNCIRNDYCKLSYPPDERIIIKLTDKDSPRKKIERALEKDLIEALPPNIKFHPGLIPAMVDLWDASIGIPNPTDLKNLCMKYKLYKV